MTCEEHKTYNLKNYKDIYQPTIGQLSEHILYIQQQSRKYIATKKTEQSM